MPKGLAQEAAAVVPPGDPFSVGSTALPALKARHERMRHRMLARGDRLGELIGSGLSTAFVGPHLLSKNTLSAEELEELRALAPEAAELVFAELTEAFDELAQVLTGLDPLLTTAQISFNHTFQVAGKYHEPTNDRSEVSVEIVASIFASQPSAAPVEPADSTTIQRIEDLLGSIRWLQSFVLVLQAMNEPDDQDGYLRMVGRLRFSTVRGESYASHGQDLAMAVLRQLDARMRKEFGFTIDEFLEVVRAAADLLNDRVNDYLQHMSEVFRRISFEGVSQRLAGSSLAPSSQQRSTVCRRR